MVNNDEILKEYLTSFVNQEMEKISLLEKNSDEHLFSDKFKRQWHWLCWRETHLKHYSVWKKAFQKIAILVLCITLLYTANQVCAKVLDINPWQEICSTCKKCQMEIKVFWQNSNNTPSMQSTVPEAGSIPKNVPSSFSLVDTEQDDHGSYALWHGSQDETLQYSQTRLSAGTAIATDASYTKKQTVDICGYHGVYYQKGKEGWLVWADDSFAYMIDITAKTNKKRKETLVQIAESLYQ